MFIFPSPSLPIQSRRCLNFFLLVPPSLHLFSERPFLFPLLFLSFRLSCAPNLDANTSHNCSPVARAIFLLLLLLLFFFFIVRHSNQRWPFTSFPLPVSRLLASRSLPFLEFNLQSCKVKAPLMESQVQYLSLNMFIALFFSCVCAPFQNCSHVYSSAIHLIYSLRVTRWWSKSSAVSLSLSPLPPPPPPPPPPPLLFGA